MASGCIVLVRRSGCGLLANSAFSYVELCTYRFRRQKFANCGRFVVVEKREVFDDVTRRTYGVSDSKRRARSNDGGYCTNVLRSMFLCNGRGKQSDMFLMRNKCLTIERTFRTRSRPILTNFFQ